MAEPTFLEQYAAKLNRRGEELREFWDSVNIQDLIPQPLGERRPNKTVPSIPGGRTAQQEAARAMSANLDDPVAILKERLLKETDRFTGRPEYVGSVGHRPTKEDLVAEQSGELASFYPPRQYTPATAQDNIYGEIPPGVNPSGSPAQSEFIEGPTPSPFPTYYSPGSFINGGSEIDADNIAISQLRSIAKEPGAAAANEAKAAAILGVDYGAKTAQSQNQKGLINEASDAISGLLGNVDFKGLFRVLARPEFVAPMGPGQTPLTNFVNAAAADRTAQAATRAAQQEAGLEGFKAETDRMKALMPDPSKMPKLTGEVNKMYDRIESSRRISVVGNKIKAALKKSPFATGGTGEASKAVRAIAAAFGISPGVFTSDDVTKNVAKLKGEVLKSKTFGREASRQELEQILNKILASPSLFTTSDQILDSVDSLMRDAERDSFNTTARLKAYGLHTSTDKNPMSLPTKYFDRNN